MAESLTPFLDRMLVAPAPHEEVTASGIHLPETEEQGELRGTVVGVGSTAQQGDELMGKDVLYSQYSGNKVDIGGDEFVVLKDVDILGVFS